MLFRSEQIAKPKMQMFSMFPSSWMTEVLCVMVPRSLSESETFPRLDKAEIYNEQERPRIDNYTMLLYMYDCTIQINDTL